MRSVEFRLTPGKPENSTTFKKDMVENREGVWFSPIPGRSRAKLRQLEGKLQQEARKLRVKD